MSFLDDPNLSINPKTGASIWRPSLISTGVSSPDQTNLGGRWSRDWEDMGALEKVSSILSAGQYASANVAKALIEGDGDLAGAIWRGITLKERGDYIDLLKKYNVPWAPLLGLILDIGLDPLTYLPGPVALFKKSVGVVGGEKALAQATKLFDNLNPIKKMGKLFNPKFGLNEKVYNELLFASCGMNTAQIEAVGEWGKLAKEASRLSKSDPEILKKLSQWKISPPTRPQDFDRYAGILSRYDQVTQRMVDAKLISEHALKAYASEEGSTHLSQVTIGWLQEGGWKPGRSIIGPGKKPGMSFERSLFKKNPEDFIPEMSKVSDALDQLSKLGTVDQIRQRAKDLVRDLKDENPFKADLLDTVEDIIVSFGGDLRKIKKQLFDQALYYKPIAEFTEIGKIVETNLIHSEYVQGFKDLLLRSKESLEGGWANLLKRGEVIGDKHILVEKGELKNQIGLLSKMSKEAKPGELSYKLVKTEEGQKFLHAFLDGVDVGQGEIKLAQGKSYMIDEIIVNSATATGESLRRKGIATGISQEAAKLVHGWGGKLYMSNVFATEEGKKLAWGLSYRGILGEAETAMGGMRKIRSVREMEAAQGFLSPAQIVRSLNQALKEQPAVFADMISLDPATARRITNSLDHMGAENLSIRAVPKDVAEVVFRAKKLFNPEAKETNALVTMLRKATGTWARWATIMRWPFDARNFLSNTSQAFLAGVEPWEMLGDAQLAAQIQKGSAQAIKIGKQILNGEEWRKLFDSVGIRGRGLAGSLVAETEVDQVLKLHMGLGMKPAETKIGKAVQALYDRAGRVATAIEDNSRVMVGINRLRKNGGDIKDAALHVKKFLYNYDELTDFEKSLKLIFPFYLWMRKNTAFQIGSVLTQPGRQASLFKIVNMFRSLNPETPDELKYKPDYMRDYGYFKAPSEIKQWFEKFSGKPLKGEIYVNIDLPTNTWADLRHPINKLFQSLSPIFLGLRLNSNVAGFPSPDTPIEHFKGELQPVPWPVALIPEPVWPILGIQPMRDKKTGRRVAGAPAKAVHAVFSLLPGLYELSKLHPQTRVYLEDEDAPWRALSYATGIKFTPSSLEEERFYWNMGRQQKTRELQKYAAQLGRPLSQVERERFMGAFAR